MKKFNLLDNVYFMNANQIIQGKILGLNSIKSDIYGIEFSDESIVHMHEKFLFHSLEEVLNHLTDTVNRLKDE
jgi:hypothetical protein